MDIFSYRFLAILLLAVVVLRILSKRKKRGPSIVQAKQIPIRGQKISSPVTKDSPLACLLDDEKIFGADFKDKDLPELPHSDKFSCQLANVNWRSHEWFNESRAEKKMTGTDLGELNRNEYRYYKYFQGTCDRPAKIIRSKQ